MAVQGYRARVLMTGASNAMTDEPMTQSGSSLTYYTTDATRNLWDPATTVVVEDGGVVVATSDYEVDYLLGEVTFDSAPSGAVTVTGAYLDRYTIATARSWTLNLSVAELDQTVFGDDAITRLAGLFDATGTVERLDFGDEDYDTGGSSGVTVFAALDGRTDVVIEQIPDINSGEVFRTYAKFFADELSAEVASLVTGALTFTGTLSGALTKSWSYGDPTA